MQKYLKSKPSGDDACSIIGARTGYEIVGNAGMGGRLLPLLELVKPEFSGTLLDAGCYGGWLYPKVRDLVAYTGIDIYPEAIKAATMLFGEHFIVSRIEDYEVQHDIVWATQLHPEISGNKFFKHLKRLSRKMLVVTYDREDGAMPGAEIVPLDGATGAVYRW